MKDLHDGGVSLVRSFRYAVTRTLEAFPHLRSLPGFAPVEDPHEMPGLEGELFADLLVRPEDRR